LAYVITDLCTQCGNCSDVCPVECITSGDEQFFINPEECIDCAACVDECPEGAIFAADDLPKDKSSFLEKNARFFS